MRTFSLSLFTVTSLLAVACADTPSQYDDSYDDSLDDKADVWGSDSRKETYQYPAGPIKDVAKSTAAMVIGGGTLYVENGLWTGYTHPIGETYDFCPGQRFAKQPALSQCSATLIAPDIVVTAGHCVDHEYCEDMQFVFDYAYDKKPIKPMAIVIDQPGQNAYRCKAILLSGNDRDEDKRTGTDFALIRLDRKVTGRAPAKVNWQNPLTVGQQLYTIGYPSGLPQKVATGNVKNADASQYTFIEHDIDVFGGNSGGGVFDKTGQLVGMHSFSSGIRYVQPEGKSCNVVAVCGKNANCTTKPNAFDTRALASRLTPALRAELGAP